MDPSCGPHNTPEDVGIQRAFVFVAQLVLPPILIIILLLLLLHLATFILLLLLSFPSSP